MATGGGKRVSTAAAGVVVEAGEAFEIRCASGGGIGDPLERIPQMVADDVAHGRLTTAEAAEIYGVVLDETGTCPFPMRPRSAGRRGARSVSAERRRPSDPFAGPVTTNGRPVSSPLPRGGAPRRRRLCQRVGRTARGGACGTGPTGARCSSPAPGPGPGIVTRCYLDPKTGSLLMVEAVPLGTSRAFEVRPDHWN